MLAHHFLFMVNKTTGFGEKSCYSLQELEEFVENTDSGLQEEVKEGDYEALVRIMAHLVAVRDRQQVIMDHHHFNFFLRHFEILGKK